MVSPPHSMHSGLNVNRMAMLEQGRLEQLRRPGDGAWRGMVTRWARDVGWREGVGLIRVGGRITGRGNAHACRASETIRDWVNWETRRGVEELGCGS